MGRLAIPGHFGGAKDDLHSVPKAGPRVQMADLPIRFGHDKADHAQRHALTICDTDTAAARAVIKVEDGVFDEFVPLRAANPRKAVAPASS
jgi:hypothetical protein